MAIDIAVASERLEVAVQAPLIDSAGVRTDFTVRRWDEEQVAYARRLIRESQQFDPNIELTEQIFRHLRIAPYSVSEDYDCNLVVQNGWVALLGGVAGTTMSPKFGAANGRIGVGTSATAAAYAQTTLQGDTGAASTTSYFKLVSGAPTISTGTSPPTLVFTAAFGGAVANFAWAEFGTDAGTADSVSNATTGGTFFNRGVSAQGTKAGGQVWTATETIQFGFPSGSGTVS